MPSMPLDPETYVSAAAALMHLTIAPDDRPEVVANFQRIAQVAQLVLEFPLADDLEAAPVFLP